MGNETRISDKIEKRAREFVELLRRCDTGKATDKDLTTLQARLAETPGLWKVSGDLARLARAKMLEGVNWGGAFHESVKHGLKVMDAELAGRDAAPIERLLADQAVTCWLQFYLTQILYGESEKEALPPAVADYWERRLSATQRRYLQALETLARVQHRLRPHAVQGNIGARQGSVLGQAQPAANGKQARAGASSGPAARVVHSSRRRHAVRV